MVGSVYQLALTDHDGQSPHPHVVVLTFSGNRDCIVVPAYSASGFKINEYIDAAKATGVREDQIFVLLDNSQHIDFTTAFPAKEAYWCTHRFRRLSQKAVKQGRLLGQMKPSGMVRIVNSLLALAENDPADLSPNAIKALRNLVKNLTEEPPTLPFGKPPDPDPPAASV